MSKAAIQEAINLLKAIAEGLDGVMDRTLSVEHPKLPREGCLGIAFADGTDFETVACAGGRIRRALSLLEGGD